MFRLPIEPHLRPALHCLAHQCLAPLLRWLREAPTTALRLLSEAALLGLPRTCGERGEVAPW